MQPNICLDQMTFLFIHVVYFSHISRFAENDFFATVSRNTKVHGVTAWWWGSETDVNNVAYIPSFAAEEKTRMRAHVLAGE